MSRYGWKGKRVVNADGREGLIFGEHEGFCHVALVIHVEGGNDAHIQLNSDGKDSGEMGWRWLCENFSDGPSWLSLGDHNVDRKPVPALPEATAETKGP